MSPSPLIGVVIPTVPGRESFLARAVESLVGPTVIRVIENSGKTCGEGWNQGARDFLQYMPGVDSVLFYADDLIAGPKWTEAAPSEDIVPGCFLYGADGEHQNVTDGRPGDSAQFPRVPWLTITQVQEIFPIPALHYYSDIWIGDELNSRGIKTVMHWSYSFIHLWAQPNRITDSEPDRLVYEKARGAA